MSYPIKTLSQLPLVLKSFRKSKGLTQAAMAEKLGITQQSYAYFEANPESAALERLFMVLRLLDVEISLNRTSPANATRAAPMVKAISKQAVTTMMVAKKTTTASSTVTGKRRPSTASIRKKESW